MKRKRLAALLLLPILLASCGGGQEVIIIEPPQPTSPPTETLQIHPATQTPPENPALATMFAENPALATEIAGNPALATMIAEDPSLATRIVEAQATYAPTLPPTAIPTLAFQDLSGLWPQASTLCHRAFGAPLPSERVYSIPTPAVTIQDSTKSGDMTFELDDFLYQASTAEDVASLVCIAVDREETGQYTDGSMGYRLILSVRMVSWPEGEVLNGFELEGSAPQRIVMGHTPGEPIYGDEPRAELLEWITALLADTPAASVPDDEMRRRNQIIEQNDSSGLGLLPTAYDSCNAVFEITDFQETMGAAKSPVLVIRDTDNSEGVLFELDGGLSQSITTLNAHTLACIRVNRQEAGTLADGSPGYRLVWHVRFCNIYNGFPYLEAEFTGEAPTSPPQGHTAGEPVYGPPPLQPFYAYLKLELDQ